MKIKPLRFASVALITLTVSLSTFAGEGKRIEDNSFLLEEAYNQEEGVIQYIQSYQYSNETKNWNYTCNYSGFCPLFSGK